MLLRQRPSAPLAPYVESLWYSARGALPHTRERSLIREFRQLAGMPPGSYAPVQADQPTHVSLAR